METTNEGFNTITSVLARHTEGSKYLYDLTLLQKGIALSDIRNFQQKLNQLPEGNAKNAARQLNNKMKLLKKHTLQVGESKAGQVMVRSKVEKCRFFKVVIPFGNEEHVFILKLETVK